MTLGRRVEGRERGVGAWRAWKGGGESGLCGGSREAVGLGVWFKSGDFEARHSYFRRILEKAIFGTRQKGSSSPKLSHRLLDADCGLRAGPGQTQESTPPAQPVSGTRTEVALWDTGEQQASHGEADGVPGAAPGSRGESRVATSTHPLPVCTPVFTGAASPRHPRGLTRRRRPSQLQGGPCSLRIRLYTWFLRRERTQPCDGSGRRIRQPVWSKEP